MQSKLHKQIWRMSRCAFYGLFLQCLLCNLLIANGSNAQRMKLDKVMLSIELKDVQLTEAFARIEREVGFNFVYKKNLLNKTKKVSLSLKEYSMMDLLKYFSMEVDVKFKRVNENIYVSKRDRSKTNIDDVIDLADVELSGKVTDENGTGLPGASIVEKGTTNGAVSDPDGNYNLIVSENATLIISYVGFVSQEVVIGGRNVIDIQMVPDAQQLEELVVVGYGTQEKRDVTGALSTVKGTQLTISPNPNLSGALLGKVTGVLSLQESGQPGFDDAKFQIRGRSTIGNNDPLILVDGIQRPFNRINPNEIESITVLKDAASTAIYGSRASNGVLLVTTKRGQLGKPSFNFSSTFSTQSPTLNPDLMEANQYVLSFREALLNEGTPPDELPYEDLVLDAQNGRLESFDWWGAVIDNSAPMQQHNFSVRGGSDIVKYFFSYGLLDQSGFIELSNYTQHSFRSNTDIQLTERLTFNLDLAGRLEDRLKAPADANGDSNGKIYSSALTSNPLLPIFLDGRPGTENLPPGALGYDASCCNSFGVANRNGSRTVDTDLFQSNMSLAYDIPGIEGLKAEGLFSYDQTNTKDRSFFTSYDSYQKIEATGEFIKQVSDNLRTLSEGRSKLSQQTIQLSLYYQKEFGEHYISALGLFEQIETEFDTLSAYRSGFISPVIEQFFAGGSEDIRNFGTAANTARRGYVARVNYAFRDKYLFQANLRLDQSYIFPTDNRNGYFPAFSAGWRISEEPFMSGVGFISNLKARVSWGITGNDRINPFQYLSGMEFGGGYVANRIFQQGVRPTAIPNPNITWETARTTDIGIEAGFLDGKFEFEFDYYFKNTDNILAPRSLSVPMTFGASLPDENLGIVDSWGWEALVSHSNNIGDFAYDISANITIANNEIIFLDEPADVLPSASLTGKEIGSRVGFLSDGLYQSQEEIDNGPTQFGALAPGDIRYIDLNGRDANGELTGLPDGQINQDDRTVIGSSNTPNLIYGLNMGLRYKGFNLSFMFQGASDYSREIVLEGFLLGIGNNFSVLEDSWNPLKTDARYPRILPDGNNNNSQTSDFWIEEINYFRLKNARLSYDFGSTTNFFRSHGIELLDVFVSGSNLFTLTNMSVGDPEGGDGQSARVLYIPLARTISVGVSIGF